MHTSCYILIFSGRGSNWIHTLDHLGVDLQRSLRNELEALDLEAQSVDDSGHEPSGKCCNRFRFW